MELAKNKESYGAVTLSTRGQITIPAQARRDFDIKPGEKLLSAWRPARGYCVDQSYHHGL